MNKPDFANWFCLHEGRRNFEINPQRDRNQLFGKPEWEEGINDRLQKSQLLSRPIRLVWWGQFGIGKTHRLRHTEFLVQSNGYRYRPCYVVASDIQEKTGFNRLHYELINDLGQAEMRQLVKSYVLKVASNQQGYRSIVEICGNAADVAAAIETFGGAADRPVASAWRFLCGEALDPSAMETIGVSREKLERAADYATVISALATIIEAETSKQLLYLVDECENLLKITNRTAEAQWNEALRAILDVHNVNIVLTVGAEKSDNLPRLILQPDIFRRILKDNYVQMEAFKGPETQSFVKGLLEQWIDPDKRKALEAAENLASSHADYEPALYPFTRGGFELFCEGVVVDPRSAKPSEILAKLNDVAAEAWVKDRRLITRDHLTKMGYA